MCSITPRLIAVIGSSASPATSSAAGGRRRGGRCRGRCGCHRSGRLRRCGLGDRCRCGRDGLRRGRLGLRGRLWRRRWSGLGDGSRRCRRGCRRGAGLDEREDVLLRHPASGSRSGNGRRVDPVLGGDARDDGRDEGLAVAGGGRGNRRGRCGRSLGWRSCRDGRRLRLGCGCRFRFRCRGRRSGLGSGGRDLGAGRRDGRENRADLDGLALLDEDLRHDAFGRARHLGVDLVRRDLEQRLVAADRFADLAEPLRDRSLGDGDAHLGHHDLGLGSCRHRFLLVRSELS